MTMLTVSGSPHIHDSQSVKKIMYGVVIAMLPAMLASFWFFGMGAIQVTLVAILATLLFEYLIQRFLLKGPITIFDGSALITGILLAFNLPANLPIWIVIIGALVSVGVGKMSFGGLGKNPFNPALVGRVFLLISFPVQMTSWPSPIGVTDAITGPTPLGILKEGLAKGESMSVLMAQVPDYFQLALGHMGGSLGEVSAILLLLGGLFMVVRRIISWHIPVAFMGSAVLFSSILWLVDPSLYANPLFHLLTGGLILGAVFMATDMVTSPMTKAGMLVFGIGGGVLTILIRVFGAYPEGVSFAILIMNALVPLINKGFSPKRFGNL